MEQDKRCDKAYRQTEAARTWEKTVQFNSVLTSHVTVPTWRLCQIGYLMWVLVIFWMAHVFLMHSYLEYKMLFLSSVPCRQSDLGTDWSFWRKIKHSLFSFSFPLSCNSPLIHLSFCMHAAAADDTVKTLTAVTIGGDYVASIASYTTSRTASNCGTSITMATGLIQLCDCIVSANSHVDRWIGRSELLLTAQKLLCLQLVPCMSHPPFILIVNTMLFFSILSLSGHW